MTTDTAEAPAKPLPAFSAAKLQTREFAARDYNYTVPLGTTPDQCLIPERWSTVARKFRTGTYLHIVDEGNTWAGVLRVAACADTWARVHWIVPVSPIPDMGDDPTPIAEQFKIDHTGSGWRVIRRNDHKVVKDQLGTRADAEKFIADHVKKLR